MGGPKGANNMAVSGLGCRNDTGNAISVLLTDRLRNNPSCRDSVSSDHGLFFFSYDRLAFPRRLQVCLFLLSF